MLWKLVLSFVILCFSSTQSQAAESTEGYWFGTFKKQQLSGNTYGWMETQIRNSFESGTVAQILYRAGLLQKLDDTHEVGVLMGIIQTGSTVERRLTLQHGMSYLKNDSQSLGHRVRLEGRTIQDSPNDSMRFRYLLRYTRNLGGFHGVIWDEPFLNVTDEEDYDQGVFERNRFFIGARFKVASTHLEVGYLLQSVYRDVAEDTNEHLLVTNWIF